MFGSKLIIYLRRNSLEVYRENTEGYLGRLEFPPETAKDEEIIDKAKFEELIESFLTKLATKEKKALIVLSDDVLFQKTIPLSDEKTEATDIQEFFAEVPFDPQKISRKQIRTKNGVNLFAVNKDLFLAAAGVLSKMQKEVQAAVPATIFGTNATSTALTKQDINNITSKQDLINQSNFLDESEITISQVPTPQEPEDSKNPSTAPSVAPSNQDRSLSFTHLVILGTITIVVGSLIAIYFIRKPSLNLSNIKIPFLSQKQEQASPPPSPTTQQTETSPQEDLSKDEITIQVLNGTGKSGQAGLAKAALETIGFAGIETGNAENQDFTATTVDFASKVPVKLRQEIVDELEKLFAEIKMEVKGTQDFDVIITTGEEK